MTKQGSLAEAIHDARIRRGLSQNKAYQELGVSRLTFRQWEKGTWEQIRLRYVPGIASFIGESEEDVLERMEVLTPEAADALRRARKRGVINTVINTDRLNGWETGRYIKWLVVMASASQSRRTRSNASASIPHPHRSPACRSAHPSNN